MQKLKITCSCPDLLHKLAAKRVDDDYTVIGFRRQLRWSGWVYMAKLTRPKPVIRSFSEALAQGGYQPTKMPDCKPVKPPPKTK